ncbi:MAG: VCBS repeat-containing protein [Candidatus Omnitrophota bacterium]
MKFILPIFTLFLYPLSAPAQTPGWGAPNGCGAPLRWGGEIGPWWGGYNPGGTAADFDGDGDMDIVIFYSIGGGAQNVFAGVYLYENIGNQEKALFSIPRKLPLTKAPLAYDWNNDGRPDLIESGQWRKNLGGFQFADGEKIPRFPDSVRAIADVNSDGVPDLLLSADLAPDAVWPSSAVWKKDEPPYTLDGIWKGGAMRKSLRLLLGQRQRRSIVWKDKGYLLADGVPLEVYGGPDPTFADWDRDGDLDLIVGSQTQLTYYENTGTKSSPRFRRGQRVLAGDAYDLPGIFIHPLAVLWNADALPDLLIFQESGETTWLRCLGHDENSVPRFAAEETLTCREPMLDAGCLAVLSVIDWDRDGDLDIVSGNSYGEVLLFTNSGDDKNRRFDSKTPLTAEGVPIVVKGGANGSIQGPGEAHFGYTCPVASDWDGDSWPDLILADIWGLCSYFERIPGGELKPPRSFRVANGPARSYKPRWVWWKDDGRLVTQWRCQPAAVDWNRDGRLDLITLDAEGCLALYPGTGQPSNALVEAPQRVFLLENDAPIRITNGVGGRSGRARIIVADWDGDGDRDIIRGCTQAGDHEDPHYRDYERVAVWYENTGDDRRFRFRRSLLQHGENVSFCGHATSPAIVDWDGDGRLDLLLGAEDGLVYFFSREYLEKGPSE